MKKVVHPSSTRGNANYGWLEANYSFSFANYYDPNRLQFGLLRVLNDDIVAPAMGFGRHPHQNMEIVTIPQSGAVKHKDSMGNEGIVAAGDIQVMSAGSGVEHSEINASAKEALKLFKIHGLKKDRITIMHCNTAYPTPFKDANLNAILTIKIIISANIDTTKASSEKIIQTLIITNAVTEIRS